MTKRAVYIERGCAFLAAGGAVWMNVQAERSTAEVITWIGHDEQRLGCCHHEDSLSA